MRLGHGERRQRSAAGGPTKLSPPHSYCDATDDRWRPVVGQSERFRRRGDPDA